LREAAAAFLFFTDTNPGGGGHSFLRHEHELRKERNNMEMDVRVVSQINFLLPETSELS
jgi:hypothetical protein